MLNVSWAKKRAKFVFVFAARHKKGIGKSEERMTDRWRDRKQ